MDSRYSLALRRLISPDHQAVGCLRAFITRGRKRTSQVCVLVQHMQEHCILVCSEEGVHPNCTLSSDSRIPINGDFKFDVEPIGVSGGPKVVTATLTYKKKKLLFEADCDDTAIRFVKEIGKAQENSNYRTTPSSDYLWVEVYKNNSKFFFDMNPEDEDLFEDQKATRENTVKCLMQEREDDFTVLTQFRVFTATWNVNGQAPPSSLTEWLASSGPSDPPDVYAIGFQELDPLGQALASSVLDSTREKEWLSAISNGLHPRGNYKEVKMVRMVGMMLIVFVEEKHWRNVSNIDSHWVRTGVMGLIGNKGGVGVRFDLHSTSLCFVNCHLAPHPEEYERRNQDFNDIRNGMSFNAMRPPKCISEHDQIYWLGDMNYRLQDTSRETVDKACASKDFSSLWGRDQLRQQQAKRKVFIGFEEGPLNFMPTYKYDVGTNIWDTSEKARTPAYCDRVLWRGDNIHLVHYTSYNNLVVSDHKPVSAEFHSGIRVVDESKKREIFQELMKQLDKEENEFLPNVTINEQTIDFGKVHFYERVQRSFTITNTGPVIVKFSITVHSSGSQPCTHTWLKADPSFGTLRKGETCEITLDAQVDPTTAWKLNCGQEKMNKFLVLHLANGKDFFISVDMKYQHSCFGCSLEALARHTTPIGLMESNNLILLENDPEKHAEIGVPFEVPTELWVLLDVLQRKGMNSSLFRQSGIQSDVAIIRDTLDTKLPDGQLDVNINSVAECLLLFLSSLREPVIPFKYFKRCIESSSTYTQAKSVIRELPKVHRDTFRYLVGFLQKLLNCEGQKANILATLFSSIMIRPEDPTLLEPPWERNRSIFLYHFLVNPCED